MSITTSSIAPELSLCPATFRTSSVRDITNTYPSSSMYPASPVLKYPGTFFKYDSTNLSSFLKRDVMTPGGIGNYSSAYSNG